MNTSLNSKERIRLGIVILIVGLLVIFFGFRKVNFNVDEVWNYGLSNNIGSIVPSIEYGKEYTGMGPFESFMKVNKGERFNYVNVWQNQANDVHPPLYYCFFHTVCSFFPGTFSIWYGIGLNMVWMALTLIVLYKLAKEIFHNEFAALALTASFGTTVSFLDTIIFIRMYAQFTFFAVLFAYLIKLYWDKELTKKFYLLAGLNLIIGMFTHYYFLIYAFFLCAVFCINLIIKKQFIELRNSVISFLGSGVIYILLWYHILGHLFRGYRGQDAISKAASLGGFKGVFSLLSIVNQYIFTWTMLIFVICIIAVAVKKKKANESLWSYESALLIVGVFYIAVVGKIAPFMTSRYIAAVGFIYILIGFLAAKKVLNWKFQNKSAETILLILFLILNLANYGYRGFYLPSDYFAFDLKTTVDLVDDYKVVEYVNTDWEMMSFFKPLTSAKSYAFINADNAEDYINSQTEDFVLLLYNNEIENVFPDLDCDRMIVNGVGNYYLIHR